MEKNIEKLEPVKERFVMGDRRNFLMQLCENCKVSELVKNALEHNKQEEGEKIFAAYFRSRNFPYPPEIDWKETVEKADEKTALSVLEGRYDDGYSRVVSSKGVDWHHSELSCLTRFPLLYDVLPIACKTRRTEYIRFVVDHILGYMKAYPIESFAGKSVNQGWVNHTTTSKPWYWAMIGGGRLTKMAQSIYLLRDFAEIKDQELIDMLQRLYEETEFALFWIKDWVDKRHNGGLGMLRNVIASLTLLDDFQNNITGRHTAGALLSQYITEAFYPDGMCIELTTAYSASCSVQAQRLALRFTGLQSIRNLFPKLRRMIECMTGLQDPLFNLPSFGDLAAGSVEKYIEPALAKFFHMPWALSLQQKTYEQTPPFVNWPSHEDEAWCGYYVMRSGWDEQARYMAIDGGPWGTTHQHGDKLSFVLAAYGTLFITDPLSSRYSSNLPNVLISRQHVSFLHNTLTIDGVDEFMTADSPNGVLESKIPLKNRWESGPCYTLFSSDYSFTPLKSVIWQRRVMFVDGYYWFLQDVLIPAEQTGTYEIEQNFQFAQDIEIEFFDRITVATAKNKAQLALVPLTGSLQPTLFIGDRTPHVSYWPNALHPSNIFYKEDDRPQMHGRGWIGRDIYGLLPAPAVTYQGKAASPGILSAALIPLQKEQTLQHIPDIQCKDSEGAKWILPCKNGFLEVNSSISDFCVQYRPK